MSTTVKRKQRYLSDGAIVEHLHKVMQRGGKYIHRVFKCKVYYFDGMPFLRAYGGEYGGKIWFKPVQTDTGLWDYRAVVKPELVTQLEIKARRAYQNEYNRLKRA